MRIFMKASLPHRDVETGEQRMEENKQEEMKQEETKENAEQLSEEKKENKGAPTRSLVLWCLGGVYLLYTGYSLCKNVLQGVEGASPAFMAAGVVFLLLGAGLVVLGARGLIKNDLRKKAEAQAAQEERANTAGMELDVSAGEVDDKAETVETETIEKRKMSIAERANLTSRLEEEESQADGEEK